MILAGALLFGRPDSGLVLVAWWTLISLIVHSVRLAQLTEQQARAAQDHELDRAMSDLAVYDMDRTVTRRPTYVAFLLHCAVRRAPWRLLLLPLVVLSVLAYAARLIDRAKLKEINHRLLIGHRVHLSALKPLVESFADKQVATNIRPGARKAIARDKAEGRRLVLATASYRLYADAIAERLGFDDVIGTGSHHRPRRKSPRQNWRRELPMAKQKCG